jgi:serine/threonine-protein kinase
MSDPLTRLNAALEGRYRIERELGEGGMAKVYVASDLKHGRKVALKVLKPELAAVVGAERFLAEIRTTANLQHPHILPLFDSGEADSFLFYAMPYVEGESLRERLRQERQLPVDDAVQIAINIAEALDYAHQRGVVHRDIKPANILLQAGQPVIADFGIALAVGGAGEARLTETGLSLGTPHYMSPEQATGDQRVGAATDIYALGCVLYEMLVGEPPYTGSTPQAILGKIIASDPESVTAQRPSVPAAVDAAIAKALEGLAADRFATAGRFAEALRDPNFQTVPRTAATAKRASSPGRWVWPAATILAAAVALWGWLRPEAPRPVARTQIALLEGLRVGSSSGSYPLAITRDGRRVAFVGEDDGGSTLFTRALDERAPTALGGTGGGRQPFFSPDGEWVGYFAEGRLNRVSIVGGAPIAITSLPSRSTYGASWGADGTIVFSAGPSLYRVSAAGGDAEAFALALEGDGRRGADSTANAGSPRWPHHLPDGRHVLVSVPEGTAVVELGSGNARLLFQGTQARLVPPRYLVFNAGEERLRAVGFDLGRIEVVGAAVPAVEGVFRAPGGGAAAFAVSETGTLVFVPGGFDRSLWLVDQDGREERVPVDPRGYRWPRVSPDGLRLAVVVDPRPSQLWLVDLERRTSEPLTSEGHHVNPAWAPDAERLVFSLGNDLHEMPWRSPASLRRISDRPLPQYMPSWSIDDFVIVNEPNPESGWDLISVDVSDGSSSSFEVTPANEIVPMFSPDGRWIAYASDASGRFEVYVRAFPGPGPRHTVSLDGGLDPKWSAAGDVIFYRSVDRLWAADVRSSAGFSIDPPRELFDLAGYDFSQPNNWDVTPDGRFVMVKSDPSMLRRLELVQNLSADLRQRMGN